MAQPRRILVTGSNSDSGKRPGWPGRTRTGANPAQGAGALSAELRTIERHGTESNRLLITALQAATRPARTAPWCSQQDSNLRCQLRTLASCPLDHRSVDQTANAAYFSSSTSPSRIEPAVPKPQLYRLLPCHLGSSWRGGRRVSNPLVTRFTVWPLDLFGFVLSRSGRTRTCALRCVEPLLCR
jgi:hypothetical protein